MPAFISHFIQHDIFLLLSHPQLSIRENTIKAFSSYITRSEFKVCHCVFSILFFLYSKLQEAFAAFNTVVDQLQRGTNFGQDCHELVFMDAYEAEGLLGICVNLVKHIAPSFLLPEWPQYSSTFNAYLMHPASTVRQTTSTIFKFIGELFRSHALGNTSKFKFSCQRKQQPEHSSARSSWLVFGLESER
jgi:hypothetical protein